MLTKLCREFTRDLNTLTLTIFTTLFARTTEVGSRTLVHATTMGPESHGQYLSDCEIAAPSSFVRSEEGKKIQDGVWEELMAKLEAIQPGISDNL